MNNKVLYEELTPQEFQLRLEAAPIAYLPLGTLEWHGPHLPLGSDGIQAKGFFKRLAERAGGIVLPMIFLGPDTSLFDQDCDYYGMDFEGMPGAQPVQLVGSAYWISEPDFAVILHAVLKQLKRAGFRIVMAHGHGPSVDFFANHQQEWKEIHGLDTLSCELEDESVEFGIQTDHAGANETSLVMALRPDLVHMENLPSDPDVWPIGVAGEDPRTQASAVKGERGVADNLERYCQILKRLLEQIN